MINWRKPIIDIALRLDGYQTFRYLRFLKSVEFSSIEQLQRLQNEKLERLLLHTYENVPYYHRVLPEADVIANNKVFLENFHKIPPLTKAIIRSEGENLYSDDYKKRGGYFNTSGGSTGEPVKFIQDKHYCAWGFAGRFLFNSWAGKDVGQAELKLWGSERDILEGKDELKTLLRRWLFNTELLNTYRMSPEGMREHIDRWNEVKPRQVWAYTDSMYKLSQFVANEKISVYPPGSIICTTAPLLPQARKHIEQTFRCKVFDQYGSREVGPVACECPAQEGLHIFTPIQRVEILDSNDQPVKGEDIGQIVITNLHNYSMPLIRYKIGDTGCFSNKPCSCDLGFPLLKEISGRVFAHFVKKDGSLVHSQFFVALFFFKPWVKEFKVVQKDCDLIDISVALAGKADQNDIDVITDKIKQVMDADCRVEFKFVDEIPPTASGKYLYTFSEVPTTL